MIYPRLRKDYDGEFVVVETRVSNNKTEQVREWIPNVIKNHHISGRAAVLGSDTDSKFFKYQRLERHRGGLLGQKRLQTYGTGDLWKQMRFNFFAATQPDLIKELGQSDYDKETIVFTSPRYCLEYPGKFYLVPHLPIVNQMALPVYLSAFDGHTEIFLLGYNSGFDAGDPNWMDDVNQVFQAYNGVRFYLVTRQNLPATWLKNDNVTVMDYRKFISYCDI